MLDKIRNITGETAYRINLGIYVFHVLVGIATYLYVTLIPAPITNWRPTWKVAISWLWSFPLYAPEFYFYVLMVVLIWKKKKIARYLIKVNMVFILIFIFIGTFIGYTMQLSYFLFFWMGILSLTQMYGPIYFILMGFILVFYLINLTFWVNKINWE